MGIQVVCESTFRVRIIDENEGISPEEDDYYIEPVCDRSDGEHDPDLVMSLLDSYSGTDHFVEFE